jgi:nucleotide-binding universal stress UspA family protein
MYSRILVALDGSEYSLCGGQIALGMARLLGCEITACHVYDLEIHRVRFQEMGPGLPAVYKGKETIQRLRKAHVSLMSEGFLALSRGYMEHFLSQGRETGIPMREASISGRSYVKILELAKKRKTDMIVMGAQGLGAIGDGVLGNTVSQVLQHATCDLLIARRAMDHGGLLVGIDGSAEAIHALHRSAYLGRVLRKKVHIATAYDPGFHAEVFRVMAHSLSPERQAEVGLARQERLHEGFIDGGLATLYRSFLDRADKEARNTGIHPSTALLKGKVYHALNREVERIGGDLLVVGRFGHHREKISKIGSNAEALARYCRANLLVTAPHVTRSFARESEERAVEWDSDALASLERIPLPARAGVRQKMENIILGEGRSQITLDTYIELGRRLGVANLGEDISAS